MSFIKNSTLMVIVLCLSSCNSMMRDIFVGNTPSDEEAWYKKGMTKEIQTDDLRECFLGAYREYNKKREYEESHRLNQECMLGKGYKFKPRGLDGKKASRCTAGGDFDGPACQSLKWFKSRKVK